MQGVHKAVIVKAESMAALAERFRNKPANCPTVPQYPFWKKAMLYLHEKGD